MSYGSVAQSLHVPDSARNQIVSFTATNMGQIAGASIRREAAALGYDTGRISISNQDLLDRISAKAGEIADNIIDGTNNHIDAEAAKLPEGLTDEQARAQLESTLQEIRDYNSETLIPRTTQWTRDMSRVSFYVKNPDIAITFHVEPSDAAVEDGCQDAIDLGETTADEADSYAFPLHNNCPHSWAQSEPDTDSLPDQGDLWLGDE